MDENRDDDIVELDTNSWISVEIDRQWPKYVATWSIRRRSGDSDYPVLTGTVEQLPPRDATELDGMLARLRQEAIDQATAAVPTGGAEEARKKSRFLDRLLGRG
jgi:hypothetical protein